MTSSGITKRVFDLLLACMGLIALGAMLPFVAAAIWVDSGRPVFYRQQRVGLGGRWFWIFKFRTMVNAAETDGVANAKPSEERVTSVGRFLRRTHMDELPQLWNILKGDMSMVGPRPERPEFVERFEKEIPNYSLRHAVKPGLAGWAIVCKGYETTAEDALLKLPYDLYYLEHQSLTFDLTILFKTFINTLWK